MPLRLLLLASDRLGLALTGAGVGVSALAANGQTGTVTQTAVGPQVHEPLDVHRGFAAKVAFHGVIRIDRLADAQDFLVGKVLHAAGVIDTELVGDLDGVVTADTVNICLLYTSPSPRDS